MNFIQAKLNPMDTAERAQLNPMEFAIVRDADLSVLIAPYLTIGIVIFVMFLIIRFTKMPKNGDQSHGINFGPTLKRIFSIHHYREGVVAQFFYVGAQLCVGPLSFNMVHICSCHKVWKKKRRSAVTRIQHHRDGYFLYQRFVCTFILRYLNPGKLLAILAIAGCCFTGRSHLLPGYLGVCTAW